MKTALFLLLSIVISFSATSLAFAGDKNEKEQARLDQACEVAREKKLAPEREKYIEECVEKKQKPDRASCERFYADHGNKAGNRAPLYYNLPECVKAFEYRKAQSG
jgi:hypothetical protein